MTPVRLEPAAHRFRVSAFLSMKIDFIYLNSAVPNEMVPYVALHLGLHCLPKYLFTVKLFRTKHYETRHKKDSNMG